MTPRRNPDLRLDVATLRARASPGMTSLEVLRAVGQPWQRLGSTYVVCARTSAQPEVRMEIRFDASGRVAGVRRRA